MKKKDLITIIAGGFVLLVVVMLFLIGEKDLVRPIDAGKAFRCAIGFKKDFCGNDGKKRLLAGLNYDLLKNFSEENSLRDSIFVIRSDKYNWVDSLREGSLDLVVLPYEDSLPEIDGIVYADPVDSLTVWAVGTNFAGHLDNIDRWLAEVRERDGYEEMVERFCETINPRKAAAFGQKSDHLSPYDELFKEYSEELGWDWRLLAAVAYEESRFSILSHSPKGASGLMQIKPSSARRYGVTDLLDPRENVSAATHHFDVIQKRYRNANFTPSDRMRFTLAAYNTGSKRMHNYIETVDSLSLNRYSWEDVSTVVNSATTAYVDKIFSTYEAICQIVDR